ncbi:helicase with zinc finger domain 2 [Chanos chanos]|uniref:Helicase with zinc finger domain 2 n=1 Tax=Chanos chanos TaxID=29144 RepID=A0A6J2WD28_CHACN|nr:helicase with zinc finger domain 2-like [Chanos chanos]
MAQSYATSAHLEKLSKTCQLKTTCSLCTNQHNEITFSFTIFEHHCPGDLLLVKFRHNGCHWRPVSKRPAFPNPSRYEVCWFFKEGSGCTVHRDGCTFARSAEEAEVWNFQKRHNLDYNSLILLAKKTERASERMTHKQHITSKKILSEFPGKFLELCSYQDCLLQEYRESSNEICIMSEHVDDVSVIHNQDLCLDCHEMGSEITWRFQIKTERSLVHVALLKKEHGAVFTLGHNSPHSSPQPQTYCKGQDLRSSDLTYDVSVSFWPLQPGVFEQWLVFDFDMRPVLLRKLRIRVGQQFSPQPEEATESTMAAVSLGMERWHRGNKVIVPLSSETEEGEELMKEYKSPRMNLQFTPQSHDSSPLNKKNYRERMHNFLYSEELAQDEVVSRLSVRGTVELSAQVCGDDFGLWRACPGELFAAVYLPYVLTADAPEGLILKRSVQSALVSHVSAEKGSNQVYEVMVLRVRGSERQIYLQLPERCCSELKLQNNTLCEMEVQFQLKRLWFCEMHKAIDLLQDLKNVLPDFGHSDIPVHKIKYPKLNAKQQAAMDFILGDSSQNVAPLLIYGPFGTGKTFTLASAAKELVRQPNTKVLICTLTNSSADLYVKDHFHPHIISGHRELKPLRIKANKDGTAVRATDNITLGYCLCSADGQSFILPERHHLDSHRVIITTTSMAQHLFNLKLPAGYFTHILIDEASQMLECEALIALDLASDKTRVVLAGDHMQMAPKLFLVGTDERSNHTLLNRLFHFYQSQNDSAAKKSRIIFNENYRSTSEIVEFVSTHFYTGDSESIKASGNVPPHPEQHPLMFVSVRGECLLDQTTMSWYNLAEVASVVDTVKLIFREWPTGAWGNREQSKVCVVTEGRQVDLIRSELRKIRLSGVSVQNLGNIQGKQFQVIVLSTVQTRDRLLLADSTSLEFFNDARVLNTAMTRARSQVVVVGDAAALCCFGRCSTVWRSYIEHCISKNSAQPQYFTQEFIKQEVMEISRFQRPEQVNDNNTWEPEEVADPILQELIDDYAGVDTEELDEETTDDEHVQGRKKPYYHSDEKDKLLELVKMYPNKYKHGQLVLEGFCSGYLIPFDNPAEHIQVRGRKNAGMSFTGDEVVVETQQTEDGQLDCKVLGVISRKDSASEFVCTLQDEDYVWKEKSTKNFSRKIMVPISNNTTKICVLVNKKRRREIPIWKLDNGNWKITHYKYLNEETKQEYVFVVRVICWKEHCLFPLGHVIDVLSKGSSLEEGLRILDLEFKLSPSPAMYMRDAPADERQRKDFTELLTFTVDGRGAKNLDDAISVCDMESHYEIGVHITDVASFVAKDDFLDMTAKDKGETYYCHGNPRHPMFPEEISLSHFSLLPGKERQAVSLIVKVEKSSGEITDQSFHLSRIASKQQLSYEEAEGIINQHYTDTLRFDTLGDCVYVAYHFAKMHRKARLHGDWIYAQINDHQRPGKRKSRLMIQELSVMFNHAVSEFLTQNMQSIQCTPLRCQAAPQPKVVKEISDQHRELIPLSVHLTYHLDKKRTDLRKSTTFSVKSKQSKYLKNAISVNHSRNYFEIGVHKADAAYFVTLEGAHHPKDIQRSGKLWSLLPDKDCRAVSLLVKVEKATGKITAKNLEFSWINPAIQLSHEEVGDIISKKCGESQKFDTLEDCISVAYLFTQAQRANRQHGNENNFCLSSEGKSILMMEEFQTLFDEACKFVTDYESPNSSPIMHPITTSPEVVRQLEEDYGNMGFFLSEADGADLAIEGDSDSVRFRVLRSVWQEIQEAASKSDFDRMADLIGTDDIHPQLLPVVREFRKALKKAYVIRSNSCPEANVGHYSLKLDSYTRASSPIRRYMDVVLQRLLHAALSSAPAQYSPQEIDMLCSQFEKNSKRAQEYEEKAGELSLAFDLKAQSIYKLAIASDVQPEGHCFRVSFPFGKGLFPDSLPIMYRDLQLEDQPRFYVRGEYMELTWKKRVYKFETTQTQGKNCSPSVEIELQTWHAIAQAVNEEQWEVVSSLVLNVDTEEKKLQPICADEHYTNLSLMKPQQVGADEHYTNLSLFLKAGDTLQVQIAPGEGRVYLAPTVQLLNVSPSFEICVEHAQNPIKCFSKHAGYPAKDSYNNEKEYVRIWGPLCKMESAANAVDDSDSIIIEDLRITWTRGAEGQLTGTFDLPSEYERKWAIEFNLARCLLCIRKRGLLHSSSLNQSQDQIDPDHFTWVAHGITTGCRNLAMNSKKKSKKVDFKINHRSMDTIPNCVDQRDTRFTVELIPKLLPDIRMENAVNNIGMANDLVQGIALGRRIPQEDSTPAFPKHVIMREQPPAGLPRLNTSQYDALDNALNNHFTLIQGPPGTGKTVVGAYIVYWFFKLNSVTASKPRDPKEKEKKEVILYCGPSNKSVDVVSEYLLKFGETMKLLRVYSRQMEMQEYPYPGSSLQLSEKSLRHERSKPELRDITLHHRIRTNQNPYSSGIVALDKRIQEAPNSLTDAEIEEYKKLLNKARLFELARHDVILCTCTASSAPGLTKSISARQILIDECAMATEPQTLVPLVSYKPEKVVLLGDHMQLRPIVKNDLARKMGMSKSLFERYVRRSRHLMLDTQYRMHEDICKFPSEVYYNGRLNTAVERGHSVFCVQPGTLRKHIVFGDIRGEETSLVVSTGRGNENSKANKSESKKAVELCVSLVKEAEVKQEHVAVLSPYNAQVALIRDQLREEGLCNICVSTITKSQGSEWRYVILSTVRSCPAEEIEVEPQREWISKQIGFVGDPNQINVGITRAQQGLCILGNQELLNCSPSWKKLLAHYTGKQCVVRADQIVVIK